MSRSGANALFFQLSAHQTLIKPPIFRIWCAAGPSRPYQTSSSSSHPNSELSTLRASGKARNGPQRLYVRLQSSSVPRHKPNSLRDDHPKDQTGTVKRSEEEQRAYDRLRPIISSLPGPIDWAVAYGSGVRHQANADPSGKPPMTDFLLSTPSLPEFHNSNLRQNPSHYPLIARLLGGKRIAWLTDHWGAGVWYVTMVNIRGLEVKYGVISTKRLKRDLEDWETLYVAGRLHKPVLPLITPPDLASAQKINLQSALTLSLLLLPRTFSEQALWTQIAGISYAGDPRMSVPGAEHPDKVANIVKGEGALEGMRALYGGFIPGISGLIWSDKTTTTGKTDGWEWKGKGEEIIEQSESDDHFASLFMGLPSALRARIRSHYESDPPSTPISEYDVEGERKLWSKVVSGDLPSSALPDAPWRKVLLTEVANIIRRPALTQSFKGLFTAGFRKSYIYALAKFRKWLHGRRKGGKL